MLFTSWCLVITIWRERTFTVGESVKVNLDHVCLDNQSHYSLDLIEFQSELCDTQSPFIDTIGINEKCCKPNPTYRKKSVTFPINLL